MKAELQLPFIHRIGVLLHIASLYLSRVTETITQRGIESIAVIEVDLFAIPDIALAVDKDLVIQRQIPGAGR